MSEVDNGDAVLVDNSMQLTPQEKDSVNYILVIKNSCKQTNDFLKIAHPDIRFICSTPGPLVVSDKIDNNLSTTLTAINNANEQRSEDGITKISLDKINQLPNYTYTPSSGFNRTGELCDGNVCLINRNDMKTTVFGKPILKWVNEQRGVTDENVREHFNTITKNGNNASNVLNYGMGGKRTKKRPKRKRKSTKRKRGTRKSANKKR